ncbi:lipopolysaccharide biosynthesis protein, partial [Acinetobacter radioresistens]
YRIYITLINLNRIFINLKINFSLFINQFMPNLYNNTTTFLVGFLLGNNAAGIFGAIRQIVNILGVFNSIVSMVIFPYLARKKEKFYLFSKFYLFGFFTLTLLIIFLHPLIFNWIGLYGNNVSLIFIVLSVGIFFIATYSLYSTNFLILRGYDKLVMRNTFFISIVGLITSYPLIKFFGVLGGALNIAIAQLVMGLTAYIYYLKFKQIGEIL